IREQKPYLVECMTFRMRGHEEASGTKYIPQELFETWGKKDPVITYENFLKDQGLLNDDKIKEIRGEFKQIIEEAVAVHEHPVVADTQKEIADMYAETPHHEVPVGVES